MWCTVNCSPLVWLYMLLCFACSLCGLERGGQEPGCGFFLCTWRILVFNIARLLIYVMGRHLGSGPVLPRWPKGSICAFQHDSAGRLIDNLLLFGHVPTRQPWRGASWLPYERATAHESVETVRIFIQSVQSITHSVQSYLVRIAGRPLQNISDMQPIRKADHDSVIRLRQLPHVLCHVSRAPWTTREPYGGSPINIVAWSLEEVRLLPHTQP